MKHCKILIILATVFLFMGARVDAALSLEARAAIEEMRARVNKAAQESVSDDADDDRYIPGRELRNVLARYRVRIYGAPDAGDTSLAHWRVSVQEQTQVAASGYKPGVMLENALVNYRTQRKVFNLVKVMKAREASARDDQESEEPSDTPSERTDQAAVIVSPVAPQGRVLAGSVTVSSSELLTQSKEALRENLERAPRPASGYEKSRSSSGYKTVSAVKPASDKTTDEVEVQKYEYKMPRNYRIMVK